MASDSNKSPHAVDIHVGAKLRTLRKERDLSQQALAESCGVTFQQVQKYERGANRISASRLVQMATVLGVDAGYLLNDAPGALHAMPVTDHWGDAQLMVGSVPGAMEALYCLRDMPGETRSAFLVLLREVAGRDGPDGEAAS